MCGVTGSSFKSYLQKGFVPALVARDELGNTQDVRKVAESLPESMAVATGLLRCDGKPLLPSSGTNGFWGWCPRSLS